MEDDISSIDWDQYYDATRGRATRDIVLETLRYFPKNLPKIAIDLGCGVCNETLDLLARGWKVYAVDKEINSIRIIKERVPSEYTSNLRLIHENFEDLNLPKNYFVIANYSLPFTDPHKFEEIWKKVTNSIQPKGVFCGQFFGKNDEWTRIKKFTFFSREEVENLFDKFELIKLEEEEGNKNTATGQNKYWHIFHIIAKKM